MTSADSLRAKIDDGTATVGVIGLGHVGLPLALGFAGGGLSVLGFDTDPAKVETLEAGRSYLGHIADDSIVPFVERGRFRATAEMDRLGEPDALLICVPTPLADDRRPDLSFVETTCEEIRRRLRSGQLVVLESTTYPGTTDEVVLPILERSGLVCSADFFVAYSPEREDPGNPHHRATTIPKVVAGLDDAALDLAGRLYGHLTDRIVPVSSTRTAEATKLFENVFRAVNIALVNELKGVYEAMEVDIWEVLDAAETKPFGFMRFNPGPGWGGHCIPVDPFYLTWKADQHGVDSRFIELAGEINTEMPARVVTRLADALTERGKRLDGSSILLLGMAYKKNVADIRESPALEILALLDQAGATVDFHDPWIAEIPATRRHPTYEGKRSVPLTAEDLAARDAVVVVTDHDRIDFDLVARGATLIIDTRGIYTRSSGDLVKA